jgi:orotate phosphoribosyltransferase
VLYLISQIMAEKVQASGKRYDRIAGVVLGSVPLAAALSMATGIPYVMVRKEKKDHGTSKMIEGDINKGDRVLVVEDVITSAGSSIAAIGTLREAGASVEDIISVIDREAGGSGSLKDIGVTLTSLVKASELLKAL